MELNEEQLQTIRNIIRSASALCIANPNSNHNKCGSFNIEPFNKHWDERTVREVKNQVRIYVDSWILQPLAEIFNVSVQHIEDSLKIAELEAEIRFLKHRIEHSKTQ